MKFFKIFSAISLLFLSCNTSPVHETPTFRGSLFDKRANAADLAANYQKVMAVFPTNLTPRIGQNYAFKIVWPMDTGNPDRTYNLLTTGIGGSHCALLVGTFSKSQQGGNFDQFGGNMYDMAWTVDPPASNPQGNGVPVESDTLEFLASTFNARLTVTMYLGTTARTLANIKQTGVQVVAQPGHGTYDIGQWNCQSYIGYLWNEIA